MRPRSALVAALAALAVLLPGTATAAPIGGLVITPGERTVPGPVWLATEKGCPQASNGYYATMRGPSLPPDGVVVVANGSAGFSTTKGFDLPLVGTFADIAADHHVALAGKYDLTVHCVDTFTLQSFGEFTGSLEFGADGAAGAKYAAIGAAKGGQRPTARPAPGHDVDGLPPGAAAAQPGQDPNAPVPAEGAAPETARAAPEGSGNTFLYIALGVAGVLLVAAVTAAVTRRKKEGQSNA